MQFILTEVSGLAQAIMSLKMSKRNWSLEQQEKIQKDIYSITDMHGFFLPEDILDENGKQTRKEILEYLDNTLVKWGAGVGLTPWKDAGHETLLRFIDISFITEDLHRGAQDDLDAHARRFDNRIVRGSTRLGKFSSNERSDWYKDKIRSMEEMLDYNQILYPKAYTDDKNITWIYTANGYVREDLSEDKDALRGNYPLSIPSTAIWKINLCELRHVYMRRNKLTRANPELQNGIEELADQIEYALPGVLGKLVRYDFALIPDEDGNINTDHYELVHTMDIMKVYVPRENKK